MLNRRSLMAMGVAMVAAPLVSRLANAQSGRLTLYFLGEQASEECKTWRTQWEPLFVASDAYKKMDYRVIYPANDTLLLKQESSPADSRWVLDTFLASQDGVERGRVTPRFFLVQGQQVVFTATGHKGWREAMWPMITDMTGTRA
jgi:hypothetical protein